MHRIAIGVGVPLIIVAGAVASIDCGGSTAASGANGQQGGQTAGPGSGNGNGNNGGNGDGNANGNNAGGTEKVAVCHAGNEVPPHFVAIEVAQPAVEAHLREHSHDFVITPDMPCPPQAQPGPTGQQTGELKVCKMLANGTTVASGTLFTFSVGSQTIAVTPGTCTLLSSVPAGPITVTETGPSGFQVTDITFSAGTGTTSPSTSSATATVVAGQTTEVQFTNQTTTTTGFIQICKETTNTLTAQVVCNPTTNTLTGTFNFTSPSFTGTQSISVVAGATQPVCGPSIQVPAGNVAIREATGTGFKLSGVRTLGPGSLFDFSGTTATVQVIAGGPEQMTQVIFKNAAPTDP